MTSPVERREAMIQLWGETLDAFRARLKADKDGELSASFMETICGFLSTSGISAETQAEAQEAVEDLEMRRLAADVAEAVKVVNKPTPAPEKPEAATAATAGDDGPALARPFAPSPPHS